MIIADVEKIIAAKKVLSGINKRSINIMNIKWMYRGEEIIVPYEFRKQMAFSGLNPTDFVEEIDEHYNMRVE